MLDAKVDIEGKTPAKFWEEAKLGYDHKIFEKAKQPVDSLRTNKSFLDAAALVYKMKNGETWLEHCERENIDPKSEVARKELGEFGITTMRWFNNTTASAADLIGNGDSSLATLYQLRKKSTTNEQRAAFLYMMQAFEHTDGSLFSMGTIYGLGQGMTDATNLIGIGIGAFTGGGSVLAAQASRAATQTALKTLLVQSVKNMSIKSLVSAGVEGAVASGVQNYVEQKVQLQKFKIDGKAYQYQHDLDTSQIGEKAAYGFGFGAGLGVAGNALGTTGSWLKGKWAGSAAPVVTPASGNRIIPEYKPNFVYKFVDFFPNKYPFTQMQGIFRNTPMFSIKSARYIRPVIKAIDDNIMAVDQHGTGLGSVLGIGTRLKNIAADLEIAIKNHKEANGLIEAQKSIREAASALAASLPNADAKFNATHSQLAAEARALTPDSRSMIQRQIDALNQYINTVGKDVANAVTDVAAKKPALDNDLAQITQLTNPSDVAARLRAAAEPFKDSATMLYEESQMRLTGKLSSHRPLSKEGTLKGKAYFETQRRLERSLQEGYFMPETYLNSANRLIPITMPNPAPGKPHNMERTWLELENFYVPLKGQKYDARTLGANMAGKIWEAYMMGQEHELLYALRYLGYSQGENRGARFALDGGIPEIIPSTVIRQELDNSYKSALQNLPANLASKTDKDWQNFRKLLDQVMIDANQGHSPAPTGQRRMEQLFQTYSAYFRIAQRYRATNNFISPTRFSMDFVIPMNNNLARARAFWLGGQTIDNPSRPDYITPTYNLWWAEKKPENGGFYSRSPFWIKSPIRLVTGGIASAPGLITYGTLGAAGLIYDLSNGNEISWEKRKDYTAYQLLQFGMIPGKTVWGAAKGWGSTFWNTREFFNTGGVTGAAEGFKGGVSDAWETSLGDMGNPLSRFTLPSFGTIGIFGGEDESENTPSNKKSSKPKAKKKDKENKDEVKVDTENKSAEQIKTEKEEEELRQKLRRFGQTVAGLNNSIAYDGKWNKDRIEAFEELKTERAEIEEQMKAHVLGDHAQAIFKEASETLDGQLRGNIEQKGRPVRVPTFQEQENIRKHATSTKLIKWHDDVRLLKNDVAQAGGFDEGRRNRLTALTGEHAKFEKDVAFLGQDMKDADTRATNWMTSLTAASKATVPGLGSVVPADAPPINTDAEKQRLEALAKTQQEKEAKEKTDREKAEADQRAKEALQNSGQNKPASGGGDSSTVTPPSNPQVQTTTPPPQTPGQQVKPPQQTVTPAPSGSEKGLGESLGDLWRATTDYTKLEGEDGAGGNALGNAFGAAVSGGWNWLSNTYTHVKNKPGGSGRGWIRDGGAAIGALIASSTVISPFWDKIWVGQIPIVGTILKLGSLFIAFMFFRKGLDTFMDPAPPLAPSTGVAQSDSIAQRRQSYLPRVEGDGYVTHVQSSAGGTPQKRVIFSDRDNVDPLLDEISIHMKDGKPVMQLVTDKRHTFVSGGEINETALQSIGEGRRHFIPRDRMPLNSGGLKDMMAEAIPHQRTPGKAEDSIYVTFQDLGTYQFTPKPELNEPTLAR